MSTIEDRIRAALDADRDVPDLMGAIHAGARRRRVRRTVGTVAASIAAVAVLATGVTLAGIGERTAPDPAPVPTIGTESPSPTVVTFGSLGIKEQDAILTRTLREWQQAVVDHLDPRGEHLATDPHLAYVRASFGDAKAKPFETVPPLMGLGKLGWHNAGESGAGAVELTVFAHWLSSPDWIGAKEQMPCLFLETPCNRFSVEGARRAFTGTFSGQPLGDGFFVAIERADGTSIVATVSNLFGNSTEVPVSGTGLTRDSLAELALDPRLSLPPEVQP